MLDLGKVNCAVAVQIQNRRLDRRAVRVRPDIRQAERVVGSLVRIGLRHDLDEQRPARKLTAPRKLNRSPLRAPLRYFDGRLAGSPDGKTDVVPLVPRGARIVKPLRRGCR